MQGRIALMIQAVVLCAVPPLFAQSAPPGDETTETASVGPRFADPNDPQAFVDGVAGAYMEKDKIAGVTSWTLHNWNVLGMRYF